VKRTAIDALATMMADLEPYFCALFTRARRTPQSL
jgi:hypothetical protein